MDTTYINRISGDFIQHYLYQDWTEERWDAEIARLKALGVEYIIVDTIGRARMKDGGKWRVTYDSELPELSGVNRGVSRPESFGNALSAFEKNGIKCFVNLGDYSDWWSKGGWGNSYIENNAISAKAAVELYHKYKPKYPNAFYGFYWCTEFYNSSIFTVPFVPKLCEGMNLVMDTITKLDSSLPLLLSPFNMEYMFSASPGRTENFWRKLIEGVHFRKGDIFCPQDAVGAGWTRLENLENVTKMYKRVIDNCGKGIHLWSNCEDFAQCHKGGFFKPAKTENTAFVPATLDRFAKQLETVAPYTECIISFSLTHYYSYTSGNGDFYEALLYYLKTGAIPKGKPVWDTQPKAEGIFVRWCKPSAEFGIAYYRIIKNGRFFVRLDCKNGELPCEITDKSMKAGDEYGVEATDVFGNKSEFAYIKTK